MADIIRSLVSTIIPVYNRPQMLRQAVDSVLAQTYRPIEIIISDDGSTDKTPRVAQSLANEYLNVVRFVRNENRGPGPAREAGRQLARGEFIQYLDSDDLLRPYKFEIQVKALRESPECGAAYGWICLHPVDGPPQQRPYKWSGRTLPTLFPWLLVDRWWNTDAPLFRRSVCDAVGPWSDLRWSQDWEYDARVGALGTRLVHCREFVCDQRQHEGVRQTLEADWSADPIRLRNRVDLLRALWQCATAAGIDCDAPECQHFARWAFSIARQCAAIALGNETAKCIELARFASTSGGDGQRGIAAFRWACRLFGFRAAGRMFRSFESLRHSPGPCTLPQSFSAQRQ